VLLEHDRNYLMFLCKNIIFSLNGTLL